MSADDDWYGELFKNELKAVSAAQVTVEASDSEYEVYFYNRHFGLDFALGQHTGCCVVAGVDALQEQRVAPGDIVLEANGTRLATSKHYRPRMGFFAAISVIRYAALPVTLRFLRRKPPPPPTTAQSAPLPLRSSSSAPARAVRQRCSRQWRCSSVDGAGRRRL